MESEMDRLPQREPGFLIRGLSTRGRGLLFPGVVLSGLLLAGCPAGPSDPASGAGKNGVAGDAKGKSAKGTGPKYPAVLDEGLTPAAAALTPEQVAAREKAIARHRLIVDIGRKPILEAAALLEAAAAETPKEPMLRHLRHQLFIRMTNDEFVDDDLARARIRLGEKQLDPHLTRTPFLGSTVEALVKSYDHLGQAGMGDALLERCLKTLREAPAAELPQPPPAEGEPTVIELPLTQPNASPSPAGQQTPSQRTAAQLSAAANRREQEWRRVLMIKAERLARKDYAAADALLEEECRAARAKSVADPDAIGPVWDWVGLRGIRASLARSTAHPEVLERIESELESTAQSLAASHPDSAEHFALLIHTRSAGIGRLLPGDPEGASRLRAEILASVENSKFAKDPPLARTAKSLIGYDFLIKEAQFRKDLIGRPAPPFDAERWVRGGPLTLETLRGKVILLEFWTATRAASVASFPRLNALHEEFHDRGLEIVGVTRLSGATWNPATKRAELFAHNPTIETEVALLEALTEHHQLRYPTFLVPAKTGFYEACGVSLVPHSIVIDRQGKIRLTQRVPDEAGVRVIRETIEKLLAE